MTVLGPGDERAAAKPLPDDLDELGRLYTWLTGQRAKVIRLYDTSADGSREKQQAREQLDVLGSRILAVETKTQNVLDLEDENRVRPDGPDRGDWGGLIGQGPY